VPSDAPIIGISAGRIPVAGRVIDGMQREYPDRISDDRSLLLDQAAHQGIPVLAICRGNQILNVSRGGSLVPHLPRVTAEPHLVIERRTEAVHSVKLDSRSKLGRIVGKDRLEPQPVKLRTPWNPVVSNEIGSARGNSCGTDQFPCCPQES
jgi:hypothetical protein